jgi:phosphoribosylformylglycinamidine cyclo-ligase
VEPARIERVVTGIVEGCRQAGCALVGGETAELPDLYAPGESDLAGFAVGVAERAKLVDGATVRPGDVVLGLPSTGLHSNGYSLARRIVFDVMRLSIDSLIPDLARTVADELLEPTRIYARPVLELLKRGVSVRAMAHITGGGIAGNLTRVLPEGCRARVHRDAWEVPTVFRVLQEAGKVDDVEMFRTFNMGIGYVLVVPAEQVDAVVRGVGAADGGPGVSPCAPVRLGQVVAGERGVELVR